MRILESQTIVVLTVAVALGCNFYWLFPSFSDESMKITSTTTLHVSSIHNDTSWSILFKHFHKSSGTQVCKKCTAKHEHYNIRRLAGSTQTKLQHTLFWTKCKAWTFANLPESPTLFS